MFQIIGFYLVASLNVMAEQMVGFCVTIMGKWLHKCFTFLIHIFFRLSFLFVSVGVCFFSVHFLHIDISKIGLSLWLHFFIREGSYTYPYYNDCKISMLRL